MGLTKNSSSRLLRTWITPEISCLILLVDPYSTGHGLRDSRLVILCLLSFVLSSFVINFLLGFLLFFLFSFFSFFSL